MTLIGYMSEEEFTADFPLDFTRGIRGSYVKHRNKTAGIVVCHRLSNGSGCACSAFWVKIEERPIWTLTNENPLTIEESIRCDCGLHGWIKEGVWNHAHDSIL